MILLSGPKSTWFSWTVSCGTLMTDGEEERTTVFGWVKGREESGAFLKEK